MHSPPLWTWLNVWRGRSFPSLKLSSLISSEMFSELNIRLGVNCIKRFQEIQLLLECLRLLLLENGVDQWVIDLLGLLRTGLLVQQSLQHVLVAGLVGVWRDVLLPQHCEGEQEILRLLLCRLLNTRQDVASGTGDRGQQEEHHLHPLVVGWKVAQWMKALLAEAVFNCPCPPLSSPASVRASSGVWWGQHRRYF